MDKNFVLVVKYECGESAFATNTPDILEALKEYDEKRKRDIGWDTSKCIPLPLIQEAHIYRMFK